MIKNLKKGATTMKRGQFKNSIETILILMIAGCILFINTFTVRKLNELELSGKSAIFINDDIPMIEDKAISEEIKDYMPSAYKMIELYDENLDLLFQAQFNDSDNSFIKNNDIRRYPAFTSLLRKKNEGQTAIMIDNKEENVYFRWVTNSRGEKRLIIVYSSILKVKGLWVFSFVCYMTLILVFILLIRIHTRSYLEKIKRYGELTNSLKDDLKD